jgi:hypothetical protein
MLQSVNKINSCVRGTSQCRRAEGLGVSALKNEQNGRESVDGTDEEDMCTRRGWCSTHKKKVTRRESSATRRMHIGP